MCSWNLGASRLENNYRVGTTILFIFRMDSLSQGLRHSRAGFDHSRL